MGRPTSARSDEPGPRRRVRCLPIALAIVVPAVAACLDLMPAAERGRMTVLSPRFLQPGLETALDTFTDLQGGAAQAPRFGPCAEVARAAAAGDVPLVLTAHPSWATYVGERVAIVDRAVLGSDTLVIVGPGGAGAERPLLDPSALVDGPQTVGIPSTESASIGMYAREALLRYGIWSQMERRLRSYPTLEATLAGLDAGEVDAAIVPRSTAVREGRQILLGIDPAFHQPIRYEILLLDGDHAEARALFDYLSGPGGRAAFQQAGFAPPG